MSFTLLAMKDRQGGYMQSHYPILLNMQSHSREATGTGTGTVTPFDKYAESQTRIC